MNYAIESWMVESAQAYATLAARHTSNRHDFHRGGVAEKARKMFEGKLGEKVFKSWLRRQRLPFEEDNTLFDEADQFDFRVAGMTIDVKTFTQDYHRRLLEMVEQYAKAPKDYYVAVRLRFGPFGVGLRGGLPVFDFEGVTQRSAAIIGWASKADVGNAPIENNGYLNNHRLWLAELRDIPTLAEALRCSIPSSPSFKWPA